MKYIVGVGLCCFCSFALSASLELPLRCKKIGGSPGHVSLSVVHHEFILRKAERECRSEYLYKEKSSAGKDGVIFSSPTSDDLGINAQNIICSISHGGNEVVYIGEIPASAVEVEEDVYQNIVQAGGSVYENIYQL